MLSVSLKTLNIILMCFDGKNNHLRKMKRNETDFFWTHDEIQFLLVQHKTYSLVFMTIPDVSKMSQFKVIDSCQTIKTWF